MLPDFIIIGAFKAGTTSLHHYFDQHPDVFMTVVKEPNFFSFDTSNAFHIGEGKSLFNVKSLEDYERLFSCAPSGTKKGEASPSYFMSPVAPARISAALPHCKLVLSLRNPVDRAYSAYQIAIREGRTRVPVKDIDLRSGSHMLGNLYSESVQRYFDEFDAANFEVILFDDLQHDANAVMQTLFRFVGVSEYPYIKTDYEFNPGGVPRKWLLHRVLRTLRKAPGLREYTPKFVRKKFVLVRDWNLQKVKPLPAEIKARWLSYFPCLSG